jgi:metallophosphoesterase superfamily enzyme
MLIGMFRFVSITIHFLGRYIAKTFAQVSTYVQPHWVLFLGDIFDEGLSASDDEFKRYFERFDAIFDYRNHEHRYLIVPGDNDVGGEYYGDKQPLLRQRFRNYFGRAIVLYHQNDIQFLKVPFFRLS